MTREKIIDLVQKSIKKVQKKRILLSFEISEIRIEKPEKKEYGDYSTNIAMVIAKKVKKNPIEIAEIIIQSLNQTFFSKVEAVKPGFINFFLSEEYLQKQVKEILKKGEKFGDLKIGKNKKVNIEFISANPTGPLTLGNGRGGFSGDVLANVLNKAGYKVEREYYINDIGEQIIRLGKWEYKGDYIKKLKNRIKEKNPEKAGEKAAKIILKEEIKPLVRKMNISFDTWFSEKSLYQDKSVEKVINLLKKKKLTYEKDEALWFKSTKFGDDKDRVLIKKDGKKTYFASDIAYLRNKFERGFKKLIFFWGADHYGYINRIKAGAEALGYKKEQIDIIIMQLVAVMLGKKENKKITRMSKRKGIYMGLDELIKKLNIDVVRFFFLNRNPGSHLIFDLDLAREKSQKNPVYYIQYAYARICSILSKRTKLKILNPKLKLLNHPKELELIKQLIIFPEIVEDVANDYQVQKIPQYAMDLSSSFHQFYQDCKVLTDDKNLREARLTLVSAVKITLKNTLDLMGISDPEKM